MDWNTFIDTIINTVLLPLIIALGALAVAALQKWTKKLAQDMDNATMAKLVTEAGDVIGQTVAYISQTYVKELKEQNKFGLNEQKEAFRRTLETSKDLILKETQELITTMYGDFDLWAQTKIEQMVAEAKK